MKKCLLFTVLSILFITTIYGQTITAPVGQALNITNRVDITGDLNISVDSAFKIGGKKALSLKGSNNILVGFNSGISVSNIAQDNMFVGSYSGYSNTNGKFNSYIGTNAGFYSQGTYNVYIGDHTGSVNNSSGVTGNENIGLGAFAAASLTSGGKNLFIGTNSGYTTTIGGENVFIGNRSGLSNISGSTNTFIGANTDGAASITNATAIGANASATASNTLVLGNAVTTITGVGLALPAGNIGISGLRFANLSAANNAGTGGGNKVLSVDGSGNVILVSLTGGIGTSGVNSPVAENWKESDGYLYNNSTNGVVIKGTGLDGNSLIIKGGVLAKEVNVKVEGSEAWPDYVFKSNYKRLTLGEVEKFIAINGHLPNIPSATEMAITGNNLGKTDVKLLEKVEELTLYLLDMKKVNDSQAAELKSLKKQVSKLRKK